MERIITLKRKSDINVYNNFDSYLVESIFSSFSNFVFNKKEIIDLANSIHSLNKKIYLRADKILIEKELNDLNDYKKIFELVDGVFFEDFAFVTFVSNQNIKTELIYSPFDAIGDYEDILALEEFNISRICVPNSKEYLLKYDNKGKLGYRRIYREVLFYSRRKLLSLYDGVNEVNIDRKSYTLQEKTRTSFQKIIETRNGSIILNDIKINEYNEKCNFILYETTFIADEEMKLNLKEEVYE